jgi:ABC-type phosphate transport system permease subunit
LLFFPAAQRGSTVIVKIVEEPHDPTGLADVLVGALGLTGVIVVAAVALGLLVGGAMYLLRSRQPLH